MSPNLFIFDIDGTLSLPRTEIDDITRNIIESLINNGDYVYFVTGSKSAVAHSQCGSLCDKIDGIFSSSGNEFHYKNRQVFVNDWRPDYSVIRWLRFEAFEQSEYPEKSSFECIESRPGALNFSVLGHTRLHPASREKYAEWEQVRCERKKIVSAFKKEFPNLDAAVGGQVSIDIYPNGSDKSQVLKYLSPLICKMIGDKPKIYFLGDKVKEGGNDFPLASALKNAYDSALIYETSGPENTRNLIHKLLGQHDRAQNTRIQTQDN